MARIVVADTNGLMSPFQFGFNLDEELGRLLQEYEIVVPSAIVRELELLAPRHREAKAAYALAMSYERVETDAVPDEAVVKLAQEREAVVLSNDREVLERCRAVGLAAIRVREGARLGFA